MERKRELVEEGSGEVVIEKKVIRTLARLARLIEELTPHLDHILSDEITCDQRRSFRKHAGEMLVLDLSNDCHWLTTRMNALCSETARAIGFKKYGVRPGETMEDGRRRFMGLAKKESRKKSPSLKSKVILSSSDITNMIEKLR
jgi:hypothetical protein